jgi:hypothetical protein
MTNDIKMDLKHIWFGNVGLTTVVQHQPMADSSISTVPPSCPKW